jgi:hypothetical protein
MQCCHYSLGPGQQLGRLGLWNYGFKKKRGGGTDTLSERRELCVGTGPWDVLRLVGG